MRNSICHITYSLNYVAALQQKECSFLTRSVWIFMKHAYLHHYCSLLIISCKSNAAMSTVNIYATFKTPGCRSLREIGWQGKTFRVQVGRDNAIVTSHYIQWAPNPPGKRHPLRLLPLLLHPLQVPVPVIVPTNQVVDPAQATLALISASQIEWMVLSKNFIRS